MKYRLLPAAFIDNAASAAKIFFRPIRISRVSQQTILQVFLGLLFSLASAFSSIAWAANISTQVDHQNVIFGDTIQVTYTLDDFKGQLAPDTTALYQDFDIVSSGLQQRVVIRNGSTEHLNQIMLVLQPKKIGALVLPSITIGGVKTPSYNITVSKQDNPLHSHSTDETFLRAQVNHYTPYVQSEVIYTTQLYYREQIQNGQMTEPTVEDALLVRLGNDLEYESTIHNTVYRVIERQYAIYPQRSGKLKIGSPIFTGFGRSLSSSDPDFTMSLGVVHRLHVQAKDTILNVQPVPAAAKNFDWFPARDVSMTQTWEGLNAKKTGEPITRIVKIRAVGITAEQIPDIEISSSAELSAYRSQAINSNQYVNHNIIGERVIKIVYIPKAAGHLDIPPIALPWWDVHEEKLKISSLPGKPLSPLTTTTQFISGTPNHDATPSVRVLGNTSTEQETAQQRRDSPWSLSPWAVLLLLCISIMIVSWFCVRQYKAKVFSYRNTDTGIDPDSHDAKKMRMRISTINTLRDACTEKNIVKLKDALFRWARSAYSHNTILSIADMTRCIADAEFTHLGLDLEKQLYGTVSPKQDAAKDAANSTFDFDHFWQVFIKLEINRAYQHPFIFRTCAIRTLITSKKKSNSVLPPMYYPNSDD